MAVKLGTETIRTIALFERITKIHAKDCIIDRQCIYFLVDPSKIGLAVGKNGSVVKEVKKLLKKEIRVIAYPDNIENFIKNQIPNTKSVQINGDSVIINIPPHERSNAIGKSGRNIRITKEVLKRYFKIRNVRIR